MSSKTSTETLDPHVFPSLYWHVIAPLLGFASRLKDVAVFTQLDLVGMGVVRVLTVMFVMSLPLSPAPVVIALVVFAVYVGDRISDVERAPQATAGRVAFMRRHETALSIATAVAYGLALAISLFGGPLAFAITLLPGAAWVLYASDWAESVGPSMKRLKEIAVLNSALVAFAWATAVIFLPLSFAGASLSPIALVLFAYFFLDAYVNVEIPNCRDVEDDAANGVSTIPLLVGVDRTRHVLYAINVAVVAVLAAAFVVDLLSLAVLAAAGVGQLVALGIDGFVGRTDNYRLLELLGELKHVLVGALLAIPLLS